MKFVDLNKPINLNKKKIITNIKKVLNHGNFILGEEVGILEKKLAKFTGSNFCITTSSGTDSLLLALMSINIKPGDEIITSPFTWISSVEMIKLAGAKPVYVDIDFNSFNLNVGQIEKKITKKTKAILAVNLFGQCSNFMELNKLKFKYNLKIIEDAAQSFGSKHYGINSCNLGDISCTSFFPSKPLGCFGDGGACFTNSKVLFDKLKILRNHGQIKKNFHKYIGINGRLDTLQASILIEKLKSFKIEIFKRNVVANNYDKLITNKNVIKPKILPGNTSVYAQYTIKLKKRDRLIKLFKKNKIPYAIFYPKLIPEQLPYKESNVSYLKIAKKITKMALSLPMHPYLKKKDQIKICKIINLIN